MNVLLVDDEPMVLRMMTSMLESQGLKVIGVSTGAGALAASKEHPIDVLITDVEMTGIDGFTLAESLVEQHPDLPVIFMSGYPIMDLKTIRQRSLLKPFTVTDLMATLSNLIGKPDHGKQSGEICAAVSG